MQKILDAITRFTQARYMKILMNSFMGIAGLTICGSLFTLIKSIPITPWLNFLEASGLGVLLSIPVSITTDAISLYLAVSAGYQVAKSFDKDGFTPSLISLGAFLLVTPFTTTIFNADAVATSVADVIPISSIGSQGMFVAIIVGILAARLYLFLDGLGLKIKMPDTVPPNVSQMFESIVPGGITFVAFLVVRYVMGITPYGSLQNIIYTVLQQPLTKVGGGLGGLIVFFVVSNILWLFGVHGGMVVYSAMAPIIMVMLTENASAFAAGLPCPHTEWAVYAFAVLGGGGATLALNIWMVTPFCKSEQYKTLGKLALPTSLFNINEPIIFGTPIIMNPYLAVPFVITPVVNTIICVLSTGIGLFVPTGAQINGFMPIFVHGALISSSLGGVIVTAIMLVVDMLIYFPFFKAADAHQYNQEQATVAVEAQG